MTASGTGGDVKMFASDGVTPAPPDIKQPPGFLRLTKDVNFYGVVAKAGTIKRFDQVGPGGGFIVLGHGISQTVTIGVDAEVTLETQRMTDELRRDIGEFERLKEKLGQ